MSSYLFSQQSLPDFQHFELKIHTKKIKANLSEYAKLIKTFV